MSPPITDRQTDRQLRVGIIGAGPAGLTAAQILLQKGCKVVVFEKEGTVGGMAKTMELWGQLVDLGPHRFFSSDPRVNSVWRKAVADDYLMITRQTRIYYRKIFFDYPLKAFNALHGLGFIEAARCVLSYLYAKIMPIKNEASFEAWVVNRFGYRLFNIFFKSYSEKLWGISCKELDSDFAAQRIKKLSLYEAIKAAITGNGGKHKTLVDEFAYPNSGAGAVYERMADEIRVLGGELLLNACVMSVYFSRQQERESEKIPRITLSDGKSYVFDHIISSMPIDELLSEEAPPEIHAHLESLRFRNTILVYLLVDSPASLFLDQWIYVHSPDIKTGRISNFRNWVSTICRNKKETILCMEYWCYEKDEIWNQDENTLISAAIKDIYETELVPENSIKDGKVFRIPKCYPVYDRGYKKHLNSIEKYLSKISCLSLIGRYGAFKYNNQDHSILMGILAAENITENKNHDLWKINTDYEYQEASHISETGLEK